MGNFLNTIIIFCLHIYKDVFGVVLFHISHTLFYKFTIKSVNFTCGRTNSIVNFTTILYENRQKYIYIYKKNESKHFTCINVYFFH
jgi:hypothetical protein